MSNIDRLRVGGTDYDIQSVVKVYNTIADMNADIANIPNGATVFVKENSPSGLEGDDELDPTSSNWVKNSAIAEAIGAVSSHLVSFMGLKIQFGFQSGTAGERTVTFSTPFTEAPTPIVIPYNSTSPTNWIRSCVVTERNKNYFKYYEIASNGDAPIIGSDACFWVAIGP